MRRLLWRCYRWIKGGRRQVDGGDQGLLTIADDGLDPKPANRRHHRGSSTFGDTVGKTTKSNFFLNKNKNSFLEWKSGVNNKLLSGLEHKVFPEFICFLKKTPVDCSQYLKILINGPFSFRWFCCFGHFHHLTSFDHFHFRSILGLLSPQFVI